MLSSESTPVTTGEWLGTADVTQSEGTDSSDTMTSTTRSRGHAYPPGGTICADQASGVGVGPAACHNEGEHIDLKVEETSPLIAVPALPPHDSAGGRGDHRASALAV